MNRIFYFSHLNIVYFTIATVWLFLGNTHFALGGWGQPQMLNSNINTSAFDYYPFISADNKALYFTSTRAFDDDIFVSYWDTVTNDWGPAIRLNSNINTGDRELSPSLSPDGKRLYFVRYGDPGGFGSYDIWYSDWDTLTNDWGTAKNVGPNVNTSCIEWSVSISRDGNKMFYTSGYRPPFIGCDDDEIFMSKWDTLTNWWGPGKYTGDIVNRTGRNYSPSLAPDDTTLYFSSFHHHNDPFYQGEVDIFVAYFDGTGWNTVVNPGPPINTPTWDDGPSISADGRFLYFASRRDSTNGITDDIWVAEKTTGVKSPHDKESAKIGYELYQNYPNPFNSSTQIEFSIYKSDYVTLQIFDIRGRLVRNLLKNTFMKAGGHKVVWDGKDYRGNSVASGIYFYLLRTNEGVLVKKMTFLK